MALALAIINALGVLLPGLFQILSDLNAGSITEAEAKTRADAAFSTMWASLIDPVGDAARLNQEIDEEPKVKPIGDEEPK